MSPNPTTEPAWLSVREAAERRHLSTKTIRRFIATGELPAERIGARLIRIRTVDVDALGKPLGSR